MSGQPSAACRTFWRPSASAGRARSACAWARRAANDRHVSSMAMWSSSRCPRTLAVGPAAVIHEMVAGRDLQVSAASFFQSGPAAAELLVAAVRRGVRGAVDADTIVDAYGGVGLFAATVASNRVILVEGSRTACADATVNLADRPGNGGSHTGRAVETAGVPTSSSPIRRAPVSDGRRSACSPTRWRREWCWSAVIRCRWPAMRDYFVNRGYDHVSSTVLDLFPQTHHVEVVTTFERRPPK